MKNRPPARRAPPRATRGNEARFTGKTRDQWAPTNAKAPAGSSRRGLRRAKRKTIVSTSHLGPAHFREPSPGVLKHPEA